MDLRKARLGMIKAMPGGWDAMAAALGMSRDALENRIYERKGQSLLTETDMQMQSFSGTKLFAQAVADQSGGTYLELPAIAEVDDVPLVTKWNELYTELGRLSQRFNEAIADDHVDKKERTDLTDIVQVIHRRAEELIALTFKVYCSPEDVSGVRAE